MNGRKIRSQLQHLDHETLRYFKIHENILRYMKIFFKVENMALKVIKLLEMGSVWTIHYNITHMIMKSTHYWT